jgi:leucine-zipper-like transcriptional regulator 1
MQLNRQQSLCSVSRHCYDFITNHWSEVDCTNGDAPSGRSSLVAQVFENSIYIFGGYNGKAFSSSLSHEYGIKAHDSYTSASTIGTSVLNDFHRFRLKPVGMPPPSLVSDFRRLINSAELADVNFVVEGKIVHAHRAVLACRSEYFRVMLLGGMKESRMAEMDMVEANDAGQNSPIELQDVSHTIFLQVCEARGKVRKQYWASDDRILTRSKVLEYLYTDAVSNMSLDSGIHLMIASERFMLDRLKSLCEDAIRRDIDVDNCIEILVASHSHRAGNLKEIALDFIMQHLGNPKIQNGLSVSRA